MDLINNKPCIINVGVDGWYPAGQDRQKQSLIHHGYAGDFLYFRNEYPKGSPSHKENPYAFKIYAFNEAFKKGYKVVLWLDCSVWCVKYPMAVFDDICKYGVIGFKSGYNCANTCTDKLLSEYGISRDNAEKMDEYASGMVGINIDSEVGKKTFRFWEEMMNKGLFNNSRFYNPEESKDKRFLFGRQDQSAYSIAAHKAGAVIENRGYIKYYDHSNPERSNNDVYFLINGL